MVSDEEIEKAIRKYDPGPVIEEKAERLRRKENIRAIEASRRYYDEELDQVLDKFAGALEKDLHSAQVNHIADPRTGRVSWELVLQPRWSDQSASLIFSRAKGQQGLTKEIRSGLPTVERLPPTKIRPRDAKLARIKLHVDLFLKEALTRGPGR